MFDSIFRKGHGKTLTAYIVFGAICLVFVFFEFMPDQIGQQGGAIVAEVNNVAITVGDLRRMEDRQLEFYSRMTGGNIDDKMRQMIRSSIVRELVQREVAAQGANREGVLSSDLEVRDQLISEPAFQVNGRFSRQRYQDLLKANRLEVGAYESSLRKEAALQRLRKVFEDSMRPTEVESNFDESLKQAKLAIKYLALERESLEKNVRPESKEVAKFTESEEGKQKIADYYSSHKLEYETPEKVRARHILIKAKRNDAVEEDRALKKITGLARDLNPEKFAEVATASSEDEASRVKGGDLGFFERGVMVPEFDKVVFSLQPGVISQPVRSDFGYHLILVEEKQEKRAPPLSELSNQIAEKILRYDKVTKGLETLEGLIAKRDVAGVERWALEWRVKWEETGSFSLADPAIPKLGEDESLFRAATQLSAQQPLAPLTKVEGKSYVLRWQAAKGQKAAGMTAMTGISERPELGAGDRWQPIYQEWINNTQSQLKIRENPRFF